jgi:hypothetical protein
MLFKVLVCACSVVLCVSVVVPVEDNFNTEAQSFTGVNREF